MERPGCVIGLSFGSRPRGGPDPVNLRLAQLCDQVANEYSIPVLAQWEIGWRTTPRSALIVEREGTQHLDTRRVMELARDWCQKHGVRDVALVAGTFHIWRVKAVARKLGLRPILTKTELKTWDPESTQWWTRGVLRNVLHETLAILYYKFKGWI